MVFLNPIFLWTLLGLSIPVAIHFWSKKKVKTIKIGSIQLLKEMNPKQTRSISLNQWFLLLLRILILSLLTLILAGPRIEVLNKETSITYLIEPSLMGMDKTNTILDTIATTQLRLLESGFPLLEDRNAKMDSVTAPDYWQLSQQMETLGADSIIVLTKGLMTGFRGMRPGLDLPIHWLVIEAGEPSVTPFEVQQNKEQLTVNSVKTDYSVLDYKSEIIALNNDTFIIDNESDSISIISDSRTVKLPLFQQKTKRILIVEDAQFSTEKIYISSAFAALSKYLNQDIQLSSVKDVQGIDLSTFDVLVWLKKETIIPFSGKKLLWQPDDLAVDLIEPGVANDQYLLRHHLNAENTLDLNLSRQLIVLLDLDQQLPETIESLDQRVMDIQEIQVNKNSENAENKPKQLKDISSWLWTMLLLVIPIERILSKYKKQ